MLTMRGPQFLLLFTVISIGAYFYLKYTIASRERERWSGNQRVRDPYAIAFLRGGTNELVQVAALTLALRGLLKVDTSSLQTVNPSDVGRVNPPIEKALLQACLRPNKPAAIAVHSDVLAAANTYKDNLQALHLLADGEARQARWRPVLTVILVLGALAAAKILVALATGHPNIGFLIVLTIIFSALMLRRIAERRTAAGEAALHDLRHLFSSLKRQNRHSTDILTNATMLAAVYGVYMFPDERSFVWSKLFAKPAGSSSSGSDGGGSDGGGCSGGCGGGCGGCGS